MIKYCVVGYQKTTSIRFVESKYDNVNVAFHQLQKIVKNHKDCGSSCDWPKWEIEEEE